MSLIVGLGNPGDEYEKTRHNIGFQVLKAFARINGLSFRRDSVCRGQVAKGVIKGEQVICLMPMTYMNLSGNSVAACMRYYHILSKDLLVIYDDADLKFCDIKMKENGGSAGHNGIKSIMEALQTDQFSRLRLGIGRSEHQNLAEFVLEKFSAEEEPKIEKLIDLSQSMIEKWLLRGVSS